MEAQTNNNNNKMVNRLAFVGNLPSNPPPTADEMKQLCSQVGEVVLFTIVYDRETGKPKGYGFCEYKSEKLVTAAVDLLHGFEHRGSNLYVSRANHVKNKDNKTSNNNYKKKKKASIASSKRKSVDEIVSVVSSFSSSEKKEILSQMKLLIEQNEKGAKEILLENPQLAQALLFIQMEFNLIQTNDIKALTNKINSNETETEIEILEVKEKETVKEKEKETLKENENENEKETLKGKKKETLKEKEKRLKGLSNQQVSVLGRVMKMSAEEIAKLPLHVQKQVRAVQTQLAKGK